MNQTLLIGLDGATATLLDPLMDNGVMPFLKDFTQHGVRSTLMSTPLPLTPPAFVSMITGRSPGHHGVFDFFRRKDSDGVVHFSLYDSRDIRCETIWSIANRGSRTASVLNFVMTAPPSPLDGILVPGMTHWKHLRRNTQPASFYEQLTSQPWFDRKTICWDFKKIEQAMGSVTNDLTDWIIEHIDRETQWFELVRYQMQSAPTDLVSVVFDGSDKIQHLCWEFLDPALVDWELDSAGRHIRDLCFDYYRKLDGFLRDIVALAGRDARVFLASDHGFGASRVTFRLNQFLSELGHLSWLEPQSGHRRQQSLGLTLNPDVDWQNTKAYCPTQSSNGIHIRIARNPGEPGVSPQCYESFRKQLVADLQSLEDPISGQPLVKQILLREDAFPGPAMSNAPDMTLILFDYGFVSTARRDSIVLRNPRVRGTHNPEGILWAAGNGIRKGQVIEPLAMVDVAPNILYSLGLGIPENLEGTVTASIFEEDHLKSNPVRTGPPAREETGGAGERADAPDDTSKDDGDDAIYQHLRALGYME